MHRGSGSRTHNFACPLPVCTHPPLNVSGAQALRGSPVCAPHYRGLRSARVTRAGPCSVRQGLQAQCSGASACIVPIRPSRCPLSQADNQPSFAESPCPAYVPVEDQVRIARPTRIHRPCSCSARPFVREFRDPTLLRTTVSRYADAASYAVRRTFSRAPAGIPGGLPHSHGSRLAGGSRSPDASGLTLCGGSGRESRGASTVWEALSRGALGGRRCCYVHRHPRYTPKSFRLHTTYRMPTECLQKTAVLQAL